MIQWTGATLHGLRHDILGGRGRQRTEERHLTLPSCLMVLTLASKQDSNKNFKFYGFTKPKRQPGHALPRLLFNAQVGSLGIQLQNKTATTATTTTMTTKYV